MAVRHANRYTKQVVIIIIIIFIIIIIISRVVFVFTINAKCVWKLWEEIIIFLMSFTSEELL